MSTRTLPRLVFLISGRGSNMKAILNKIRERKLRAQAVLVFSDKPDAAGLAKAKESGVPVQSFSPKECGGKQPYEERLISLLKETNPDLIICAGYMRILGGEMIRAFPRKIINIHPSLLPAFPGLKAQRQAIEAGVRISGCTIHFVDEGMDTGPIILQKSVEVRPEDTEETLSRRIMRLEHEWYWQAVAAVLRGFRIQERKVILSD